MKSVNKRSDILLSAVKVFAKVGFEKATVDERDHRSAAKVY